MYQILCDGELLYDPRQKEYLVGAPTLELAVNTSGTLSFSMPPTHPAYDKIRKLKSVITLYQDGEWVFSGRVLNDEKNFHNIKQISVEGELGYLNDSNQRSYVCDGLFPKEWFASIIERHNADVDDWKKFTVGEVTVTDGNDELYYSSDRTAKRYCDPVFLLWGNTVGDCKGTWHYTAHCFSDAYGSTSPDEGQSERQSRWKESGFKRGRCAVCGVNVQRSGDVMYFAQVTGL